MRKQLLSVCLHNQFCIRWAWVWSAFDLSFLIHGINKKFINNLEELDCYTDFFGTWRGVFFWHGTRRGVSFFWSSRNLRAPGVVFHSDTMRALGVVFYSDTGVPGAVFHSDTRSLGAVFPSDTIPKGYFSKISEWESRLNLIKCDLGCLQWVLNYIENCLIHCVYHTYIKKGQPICAEQVLRSFVSSFWCGDKW